LPIDQTFHRYSTDYVVSNPATTHVLIAFRPVTAGISAIVLDNVVFATFVESSRMNISFWLSGNLLNFSWPGLHLGWYLQSNSLNIADPIYCFDVPGSEAVANLTLTVDATAPRIFYRLQFPSAE
jgi:hypothetical protein